MQILKMVFHEKQQFCKLTNPKVENILTEVFTHLLVLKYNEDFPLLILLNFSTVLKIITISTIFDAFPIHWLPQH